MESCACDYDRGGGRCGHLCGCIRQVLALNVGLLGGLVCGRSLLGGWCAGSYGGGVRRFAKYSCGFDRVEW